MTEVVYTHSFGRVILIYEQGVEVHKNVECGYLLARAASEGALFGRRAASLVTSAAFSVVSVKFERAISK